MKINENNTTRKKYYKPSVSFAQRYMYREIYISCHQHRRLQIFYYIDIINIRYSVSLTARVLCKLPRAQPPAIDNRSESNTRPVGQIAPTDGSGMAGEVAFPIGEGVRNQSLHCYVVLKKRFVIVCILCGV